MKRYIFTVKNSGYALRYESTSTADTFMCAMNANTLMGGKLLPNLDWLLAALADMEAGRLNSQSAGRYELSVMEVEA